MTQPSHSGSRVSFATPQVNLYAHDIEASLRFYRDVLGFTEAFRTPREGPPEHVELQVGTLRLGLATFDALRLQHGIRTEPGPPRGELVLFADDADRAYRWTTSRGASSVRPPHEFRTRVRSAIADPDGNRVVFTSAPAASAGSSDRPSFRNHLFDLYTADIATSCRFYGGLLGFRETFRTPEQGSPDHVEMELGPLNLGVSTLEALHRHHGLSGGGGPPRGEVVLWTGDADAAFVWLTARGAPGLSPPHDFARTLRGAWIADPDGNPVQLVVRRASR